MPVYVFREGTSNMYKIGRAGDIDSRRRQLNGGNSQGLFEIDVIETENESACESFFHKLLATRRRLVGGGTEFFEMDSEDHMRQTIEQVRQMSIERERTRKVIAKFETIQCNDVLLEPTSSDADIATKLQEVSARLLKMKQQTEYLNFERELLESQLKERIGESRGIRGVATWETKIGERFSEALLRQHDPDLYQRLLERFPRLDTKAWRKQQLKNYNQTKEAYCTTSIKRRFVISALRAFHLGGGTLVGREDLHDR